MKRNLKQQNRRSTNLPTPVYEQLSFLQAEVRLIMKRDDQEKILSKTAMTQILTALITNMTAEKLAEILK